MVKHKFQGFMKMTHGPYFFLLLLLVLKSIDNHQRAVHFLRGFEKRHYKEHKNNANETMDFLLLTFSYSFIYVLRLSTILHHNKGIFLSFRTVLTSTIIN